MQSIRVYLVLLITLFSGLYAEDTKETQQERIDSVRQAIDNFSKIDEKELSEVNRVKKMFKKGEISGQIKLSYADVAEPGNAYATAVGGIVKYELAEYRGFNAGVALYSSNDIGFASGEGAKRSSELSSDVGNHADISEAYINYKYKDFSLRAGRQTLNTPLADTDDIRMIQNSFEAYVAKYNYSGIEFMLGNIQQWHGFDAGLEDGWSKTGEEGTNFVGVSYADTLEFNSWFYNITQMSNASYFDIGVEYALNSDMLIHTMVQYLHESEIGDSGVSASIYGALFEFVLYDIGFNIAFNKSQKNADRESFSGFGGGALFTNMDTMIIDEIAKDREALAYVAGVSYRYGDLEFLYAYGDFLGERDSSDTLAHISEQNIGLGYSFSEKFVAGVLYVIEKDFQDSANNWNRAQVALSYNF